MHMHASPSLSQGVMLSHDNVTWTARIMREFYGQGWACEHLVSYLPLSHVAAQVSKGAVYYRVCKDVFACLFRCPFQLSACPMRNI